MTKCIKCGSYADQGGLCDVHYWQGRAHRAEALLEQPAQQKTVAWMHEWEDGKKSPMLMGNVWKNVRPKSVRPLVYGDIAQPEQPAQRKPLTKQRRID